MPVLLMSEATGRAERAVRFGMAGFRRGRRAIDRRPAGLVWISSRRPVMASGV
ncbi:hypothetical protein ACFU99_32455 [Streptomyces sp. NPDC057654]|uniref:hypothetical protein n=1 Tax=Streptomyces sp. NPDC057654 TaxID=3346196 RepID=UPI0036AE9DB7